MRRDDPVVRIESNGHPNEARVWVHGKELPVRAVRWRQEGPECFAVVELEISGHRAIAELKGILARVDVVTVDGAPVSLTPDPQPPTPEVAP